jgi:hypothetical protein
MELPPFLLNDWLESQQNLRFDLAGSTGPRWTMRDLTHLGDPLDLSDMPISYAPPAGLSDLRAEIAAHHGVDPNWVVVTNGASEAFQLLLLALFRRSGNVLLPMPAYTTRFIRQDSKVLAEVAGKKPSYRFKPRDRPPVPARSHPQCSAVTAGSN